MPYKTDDTDEVVTLNPTARATAAVIWLHGLGADGYDFVPIVQELGLPDSLPVRFIFPHARPRPVTINNGFVMRAWYDIKGLAHTAPEDEEGIRESAEVVGEYIARELAAAIPAHRIVIAGFSQGGAIALHAGLRYPERLAGIAALSTYLPLAASLPAEASAANRDIPILMCHGQQDPIVPIQLGDASRDLLRKLDYKIEWHAYPMAHQVCVPEIQQISAWLQAQLTR